MLPVEDQATRERPATALLRGETPLTEVDFVVVDVETTGFAPQRGDRIVEIAALRCRPGAGVVDRFVTLINPQRALRAHHVHRLRDADVRTAPTFASIAPTLEARLGNAVLVAHHATFDVGFLNAELARAGRAPLTNVALCTMQLSSALVGSESGQRLEDCCARFAVPYSRLDAHGAEHDARATARLLLALLRLVQGRGVTTLRGLLRASLNSGERET